jgi:hypothetical protein
VGRLIQLQNRPSRSRAAAFAQHSPPSGCAWGWCSRSSLSPASARSAQVLPPPAPQSCTSRSALTDGRGPRQISSTRGLRDARQALHLQ